MEQNDGFEPDEQPASPQEIVNAYVRRSRRKASVGVRKSFVQQGGLGRNALPGPLARLVRNGDIVALDAYLFARLMGSQDPWDVQLPADVWALMLGLDDRQPQAARNLVSKALHRLEKANLIKRQRVGRRAVVYPLHESGNGDPYTVITGGRDDPYLQLPLTFWTKGWHGKLQLPAQAMLLVALDQKPMFSLTPEYAQRWYGVSAATASRGYTELKKNGLLEERWRKIRDDLSPVGWQRRLTYRLVGDFAKPKESPPLDALLPPDKSLSYDQLKENAIDISEVGRHLKVV